MIQNIKNVRLIIIVLNLFYGALLHATAPTLQSLGFNQEQRDSIYKIVETYDQKRDPYFALQAHIYYKQSDQGQFQTILLLGEWHQQRNEEVLLAHKLIDHSKNLIVENFIDLEGLYKDETLSKTQKYLAELSLTLFITTIIQPTLFYHHYFSDRMNPSNAIYILQNRENWDSVDLLEAYNKYDDEFFMFLRHYSLSCLETLWSTIFYASFIGRFDFENPATGILNSIDSLVVFSLIKLMRYALVGSWEDENTSLLFTSREPNMLFNLLRSSDKISLNANESSILIAIMGSSHLKGVGESLKSKGFIFLDTL